MNGAFGRNALLLMQFWQLHMQHMLAVTLHHDVIMSSTVSTVSKPHSYFRMEKGQQCEL